VAESALLSSGPIEFPKESTGISLAPSLNMGRMKQFVYVIKTEGTPTQFHVGLTSDVDTRLADHNRAACPHTASRKRWQLHVVIAFPDEARAVRFERYLKSGSGRAFARRHFGA
jgi:predicted GIY-YIG superfamily endonuclease